MLTLALVPARHAILRCENPLAEAPAVSRILVIRLGAVGDVVRTLPAASALRNHYPRAKLAWLVEPSAQSVLEGVDWLDDVLVFPRASLGGSLLKGNLAGFGRVLKGFLGELRAQRFELVVDFHSILKSGVLGWMSGSPLRAAYGRPYGRELGYLFASHRAKLHPSKASRFQRNEALVRFLGIDAVARRQPLCVAEADRVSIRKELEMAVPNFEGARSICINPGTSRGAPHKRYTVTGYAEIAKGLAREGFRSVVTWGPVPEEESFARAIVEASEGAADLAPPTPSLMALAALLAECRLYVGSDTGPMHISSLVGTPVVQLMGPTDPLENTPFEGTPWRRARVEIACNPCRRGCSAAPCMSLIPPAKVLREALSLLA